MQTRFMRQLLSILLILLLVNPTAFAQLNTALWTDLLAPAVDKGAVDYAQWANNPDFRTLVDQIAATETNALTRQQLLAFYINTYNILAAQGILNGSSPDSILGRYLYFKRDKYTVAGQRMSLHQLEHDWLRPMQEPRIHFAIVCASQSCPVLQNEAYTAARLEAQLDAAARGFINDPSRNRFDSSAAQAALSSIFKWFREDFIDNAGSLQAYLAPLVDDANAAALLADGAFSIRYLPYNWRLNGAL
ncbi:MAG: DUF547 domain-containing protein [Halioglobus sp.]|nr:DUF547 domain-containing protein [Halioglobus sp.]